MLTFEDFFAKKKIDLRSLAEAMPILYAEFKLHYEEMGEKSFDHTKKFWFNRLRKDYLLVEKPIDKVPAVQDNIAEQAEKLPSTTVEQVPHVIEVVSPPSFKPRFAKPQKEQTQVPNSPIDTPEGTTPELKKPAFKPGFMKTKTSTAVKETPAASIKEGNVNVNSESVSGNNTEIEKEQADKPVVGFKPRTLSSKSKAIPKKQEEEQKVPEASEEASKSEIEENTEPKIVTGFKPRVLKQKPSITEENKTGTESVSPTTETRETPVNEEKVVVKPAFRPRVLSKGTPESKPSAVEKTEEKPTFKPRHVKTVPATQNETPIDSSEEKSNEESKPLVSKPAFKPRLGVKTGEKKSDESSDSPL